ncbi:hypothetical protein VKT23_010927 [Stygiomarasmius scandens]|uniref:Uncharacterized protein n=1 Tax=Marasmiellus scandens TaxID=2682957 RepID=A0ABR1JBI0_9AGAR
MSAFPRSVFSETELEACRWFANQCGADEIPTVRTVKRHRETIVEQFGAGIISSTGNQGNIFSILDLSRILAQEFSNPLVRPHISVLSEDSGEMLDSACQAQKWRDCVNANLTGPMARHNGNDFFVNEPALVNTDDQGGFALVLPTRWFLRRKEDGSREIWARVQYLDNHPHSDTLIIDMRSGQCDEIPLHRFFASYSDLKKKHRYYGIADPDAVTGIIHSNIMLYSKTDF